MQMDKILPLTTCRRRDYVGANAIERTNIIANIYLNKNTRNYLNSTKERIVALSPYQLRPKFNRKNSRRISSIGEYVQYQKEEIKAEVKSPLDECNDNKEETKSRAGENKCSVCYKNFTDELLKIPTCSHKFCKLCFEKDFKGTCRDCVEFFKSMDDKSSKIIRLCNLCTNTASIRHKNCHNHAFCKTCYDFLKTNDFSHIKNLKSCNDCLNFFKVESPEKNKVYKVSSEIIKNREDNFHSVEKKITKEELNLLKIKESPEKINRRISESISSKNLKNDKINPDSVKENKSGSNKKKINQGSIEFSSNTVLEKCYSKNCEEKSNRLHSVPMCREHRYCETCFKTEQPIFDCDSCYNYFTCINLESVFNFLNCSLCGQETEYSLFNCDSHRYCVLCYQFFIKNDFSHIKFVINCEECKSFFNNSKSLEERKELKNKVKRPRSRSKSKFITNGEISVWENVTEYKKCSNEICSIKSEKIFKTTTCSEHQYCINCIKNENIQCSCTNCKKYFKQQKSNFYLSNNWCHVCLDFVPNPKYKCSLHTYCKNCYKYLEKEDLNKIHSVSNCNECKLFFEKFKSQASNKIINHAESKPKLPCCACNSEIQSEKLYTTSKCNFHKYCKNCIQSGRTSSSCGKCSNYSKCLYLSVFNLKDFCFVCEDKNLKFSNYCKLHNYCARCYEFLKNNDIGQIEMVSKCNKCSLDFKVLKL